MPAKRKKDDPFDTPEYRKLVADIRKVIDDAAAKGVDLRKRDDLLACRHCGAYEDELFDGPRVICDRRDKIISNQEFILIDRKERMYHRGGICYCKMTYDFICPICGVQQRAVVRERFEEK